MSAGITKCGHVLFSFPDLRTTSIQLFYSLAVDESCRKPGRKGRLDVYHRKLNLVKGLLRLEANPSFSLTSIDLLTGCVN